MLRNVMVILFVVVFGMIFMRGANATIVLDLNGLYFSDALSGSSDQSNNRTFYQLFAGFSLDKKDQFQLGWSYTIHSTADTVSSTESTYSSTQMGPGFLWRIDKDRRWRLAAYYHLQTTGKFKSGSSSEEEWRGDSYSVDFGYQIPLTMNFEMALRLNYSAAAYNESFDTTTKTDVSYSRSFIYPSIGFTAEL